MTTISQLHAADLVFFLALGSLLVYGMSVVAQRKAQVRLLDSRTLILVITGMVVTEVAAIRAGDREVQRRSDALIGYVTGYSAELRSEGVALLQPTTPADDATYLRIIERLRNWATYNPAIADVYVYGIGDGGQLVLLADAETDLNRDGDYLDPNEARIPIGDPVRWEPDIRRAFDGQIVSQHAVFWDQWGSRISAFAPVTSDGRVVAVVGVDFPAAPWVADMHAARAAVLVAGMTVLVILLMALLANRLVEARSTLRASAVARDAFLASVSHELRTPLHGILGLSELLAVSPLPQEQLKLVRTLRSSAMSMLGVVNDVIDLAAMRAGKLRLVNEAFLPSDIVRDVIEQESPAALRRNIELAWGVRGSADERIEGDPVRFRQIVANLVNNAVKYTDRGGVRALLRVDPVGTELLRLTLKVVDTGRGISPEHAQRLFQPFEQAVADASLRQGSGLGLAMCRQLATSMEASITFTSRRSAGTTFTFQGSFPRVRAAAQASTPEEEPTRIDLPLTLANAQASPPHPAIPPQASLPASPGAPMDPPPAEPPALAHVLVVEDNPVNQMVICLMLRRMGYSVDVADDGVKAVAACEERAYDLVLMDLNMPNLNGVEAARQIRQSTTHPQPPVLALTASVTASDRAACDQAGMNGFLTKPVDAATLARTVQTWLRRPEAEPPPQVAPTAAPNITRSVDAALPLNNAPTLLDWATHDDTDVTALRRLQSGWGAAAPPTIDGPPNRPEEAPERTGVHRTQVAQQGEARPTAGSPRSPRHAG